MKYDCVTGESPQVPSDIVRFMGHFGVTIAFWLSLSLLYALGVSESHLQAVFSIMASWTLQALEE